jgi:hypothetical protein
MTLSQSYRNVYRQIEIKPLLLLNTRRLHISYILALIIILFLQSGYARAENEYTTYSNGIKYRFVFTGTASGPKGKLMLKGKGQTFVSKDEVATSYQMSEISKTVIKLISDDGLLEFEITPKTRFCKKGKKTSPSSFKPGDDVIVTSLETTSIALSIQNGPLLFTMSQSGASPDYLECK